MLLLVLRLDVGFLRDGPKPVINMLVDNRTGSDPPLEQAQARDDIWFCSSLLKGIV